MHSLRGKRHFKPYYLTLRHIKHPEYKSLGEITLAYANHMLYARRIVCHACCFRYFHRECRIHPPHDEVWRERATRVCITCEGDILGTSSLNFGQRQLNIQRKPMRSIPTSGLSILQKSQNYYTCNIHDARLIQVYKGGAITSSWDFPFVG